MTWRLFLSVLTFFGAASPHLVAEAPVSFANDVMPGLIKAGCASGNCHAKPEGQNNFKISVFGYDPDHDYREIIWEDRGRRILMSAPEDSLLLKKATGQVTHEGGSPLKKGDPTYQHLVNWIKQGAPRNIPNEAKLSHIEVSSKQKVIKKGEELQLQVTAHYSDKSTRNVTALSDYISESPDLASVTPEGKIKVGNIDGESAIVVRYIGHVAITFITVPAERVLSSETYTKLNRQHPIDDLVYKKHQELGILTSPPASDEFFLRRVSLDITGKLPSIEMTEAFLKDTSSNKREKLIDQLLQDPNYADFWAVKWGDLIRPNPSRVGVKPVYLMDDWLRSKFRDNQPYDQMIYELFTAKGSSHAYGPVAMFRDKRDPVDMASFMSQIFMGIRLDCAKCHHHPSEKWTQEDYYQLAAFFAKMQRKGQGISAPISGEPEYWWPGNHGNILHPITEVAMKPKAPDGPEFEYVDNKDVREELMNWLTDRKNPTLAKALVNRYWSHFMGRGIVEPIDDFRISNPPTNEPLLEWLTATFIEDEYDLKKLIKHITTSQVYQVSSSPNETNVADQKYFSRFLKRRLTAEVLLDAVIDVTGVSEVFSGTRKDARAMQTWNYKLPSTFLDAFGRPNSSEECPCERDRKPSMVQALHLMNSTQLQDKLNSSQGRIHALLQEPISDLQMIERLYLTSLNRRPTENEVRLAQKYFASQLSRKIALEDLAWSLINSAEFVFNH